MQWLDSEKTFPGYQYIKRHSEFEDYFIPDHDHPSYSFNSHKYNSLGRHLLMKPV